MPSNNNVKHKKCALSNHLSKQNILCFVWLFIMSFYLSSFDGLTPSTFALLILLQN